MNKAFFSQLEHLYTTLKLEDEQKPNRLDRWRNLEPQSALLISMLIRGQQTKALLEIGTSNGYSTLWFADALKSTGGHLTTIEIEPQRTQLAQASLEKFGFLAHTTCLTIDAQEFLQHAEPKYDLIFLDAERAFYKNYWPDLRRLLIRTKGAVLVVDNVISHASEVLEFIQLIRKDDQMLLTTVDVGAGLLWVACV
ncbi:putative O-methyltransferase YrrM [Runella defluvii]|uniref:Putative O-methyltransferase YrrM n=1 Tax=Runella defluvii TaxID=370973 RepID=A0A7W6ENC5_9BACT|nr:class I SAM-dependent methyltransferase [Runella defluvii]MBB3836339.1 putative O-methyltransferase YrrM [Runella defluvii]